VVRSHVTALRRSRPVQHVDTLTRLPDRRSFEAGLSARLSEEKSCGVLLVGINGFKNINNVYGYDAGDLLLRNVALRLRAVVGDKGDIYRFAGDTFAVVFRPEDAQDAGQLADAAREAFKRAWRVRVHEIYATAAVGMALSPRDGATPQDLMHSAEDAFFREKQHGKSCHALYPVMQSAAGERRMAIENGMRRAIENGFEGVSVCYQPVINLEQGKVTGAEALLRFESDGLGEVEPGEFIPLAEYLGLIVPLGRWVLEKACAQCRRCRGGGHADMYVSVNISVMQVLGDDLAGTVRRTLDKTGLEPGGLVLEITENMFIQEMDAVVPALHALREMGVRISLDDFGKGYSSLTHLRGIPLDEVKIDRDFIRGLGEQAYYETFIHTIVTLAHTINLKVISEGIETHAQRVKLAELGSDNGQGFYVSPALHPESLLAML
jgi:diguanylate cyclase (GGDEF)-like protein